MPLYEYECDVCAHRFERIQKFSDPPPAACPTCGGAVTKLLSSPAIQFKGSGFYLTDYGRSGSKNDSANVKAGKNDSGSNSSSESKSTDSKSSESKPSDSGSSTKSDSGSSSSDSSSKPAKPATPSKSD
jgi:putative FmdB family regulatory protein